MRRRWEAGSPGAGWVLAGALVGWPGQGRRGVTGRRGRGNLTGRDRSLGTGGYGREGEIRRGERVTAAGLASRQHAWPVDGADQPGREFGLAVIETYRETYRGRRYRGAVGGLGPRT
jgi:hypothetical protein